LFSKLSKGSSGSSSDSGTDIFEKLEEWLNGDVKFVTKLRCPSK
jgi:hypothetical protein